MYAACKMSLLQRSQDPGEQVHRFTSNDMSSQDVCLCLRMKVSKHKTSMI